MRRASAETDQRQMSGERIQRHDCVRRWIRRAKRHHMATKVTLTQRPNRFFPALFLKIQNIQIPQSS